MFGDGVNMARIADVRGDPHCAPYSSHFTMRDRKLFPLGVHWRSLVSNFGDFGDFDANFHDFFRHLPDQLTFSAYRGCEP